MKTNAMQHSNSTSNRHSFKFFPLTGDQRVFDTNGLHAKYLRHTIFDRHKPTPWHRNRTAGQAVSTGNAIGFPIMQEPEASDDYLRRSDITEPTDDATTRTHPLQNEEGRRMPNRPASDTPTPTIGPA